MLFKPKDMKIINEPKLYLNGKTLDFTDNHKYLGIIVQERKSNLDINRQLRRFHANANRLLLKFNKCSYDVKIKLFSHIARICTALSFGHMLFKGI